MDRQQFEVVLQVRAGVLSFVFGAVAVGSRGMLFARQVLQCVVRSCTMASDACASCRAAAAEGQAWGRYA